MECSLAQFREFYPKEFLSPKEVNEKFCIRFQKHLLGRLTGETPLNYFAAFSRVVRSAKKEGYFHEDPLEEVKPKGNPSKNLKEILEAEDYVKLMETPHSNREITEAFVVSCYTGLRWCDVSILKWDDFSGSELTTRIIQKKTNKPLILSLHSIVRSILQRKMDGLQKTQLTGYIFKLPTADGANKSLKGWLKKAGIDKHITWSCARLSFSVLLQDANVASAIVALLLGHTTTKLVNSTYKRYRLVNQLEYLGKLPQVIL